MKKINSIVLGIVFIAAGLNHFVNPAFYLPLIPPYFPWKETLNFLSGAGEMILGVGVLYPPTRRLACYGIIALLVCLVPAHVWMIQQDGCITGSFCIPVWAAWLRLIIFQPLLIGWAYACSK